MARFHFSYIVSVTQLKTFLQVDEANKEEKVFYKDLFDVQQMYWNSLLLCAVEIQPSRPHKQVLQTHILHHPAIGRYVRTRKKCV